MVTDKPLLKYKTILFGNIAVGKTSLVDRFVNDKFQDNYISTLGYNVYEKRFQAPDFTISLLIYDIGGQEQFRDLRKRYAEGADTAMLIYEINKLESYEAISRWKMDLQNFAGDIPFIVIGNKLDLAANRQVDESLGRQLSDELGALGFYETSAKTGDHVEQAFHTLAMETARKHGF